MAIKFIWHRVLGTFPVMVIVLVASSCTNKDDGPTTLPPYEDGYAEDDFPEINSEIPSGAQIAWSSDNTLISHEVYTADYGRVHRINSSELILTYQCGPVNNTYDNIAVRKSYDNRSSWSEAEIVVAYNDPNYDGFATPETIALENGTVVNNPQSPWILWSSTAASWNYFEPGAVENQRRWLATNEPIWGGAPYLIQSENGNTIMSVHDTGGRPVPHWHKNTMLVLVGNDMAQNFTNVTYPWPNLPVTEGAINNSLFMKDAQTVVAVASRIFADGHGEVYWKEGQINF